MVGTTLFASTSSTISRMGECRQRAYGPHRPPRDCSARARRRRQIEQGLRWSERIVAASGSDCASTFTLPEWLHEVRAELLTEAKIARWQRVVDLLVVAGDGRVADLTD